MCITVTIHDTLHWINVTCEFVKWKKWLDRKVTNEDVWKRKEERKSRVNTLFTRQKKWIGHVQREETCLLREALEEKMGGKPQKRTTKEIDARMDV